MLSDVYFLIFVYNKVIAPITQKLNVKKKIYVSWYTNSAT